MRIISEKPLRDFWQKFPEAKTALKNWLKVSYAANWESFADVRKSFRHGDVYGCCAIFDVGGNKYRLIAHIDYTIKIVFVRFILTHAEYDEDKWKNDC